MKIKKIILSLIICISYCSLSRASENLANQLLQASDRSRGGVKDGIQWVAKVESSESGEQTNREFDVKANGDNAYVEAIAPARNKGEIYLFNDRNMWFFKPSLKKPVSISARQKLTGQAANGDIASTHYARDYDPVIEKTENLDGEKTHVLLLTAKTKNLTYDKIRYWINDKSKLAVKAEFLTLQGKAFKIGYLKYQNKLTVDGQTFPFVSELKIVDAKFENNKSIITYANPKSTKLSPSLFNVNNLTR